MFLYEIHISLNFPPLLFTTFAAENIIMCSENVFVNSLISVCNFLFLRIIQMKTLTWRHLPGRR